MIYKEDGMAARLIGVGMILLLLGLAGLHASLTAYPEADKGEGERTVYEGSKIILLKKPPFIIWFVDSTAVTVDKSWYYDINQYEPTIVPDHNLAFLQDKETGNIVTSLSPGKYYIDLGAFEVIMMKSKTHQPSKFKNRNRSYVS
jgi:hypothetical protein